MLMNLLLHNRHLVCMYGVLFWVNVAVAFTTIKQNLLRCLSYRKFKPIYNNYNQYFKVLNHNTYIYVSKIDTPYNLVRWESACVVVLWFYLHIQLQYILKECIKFYH
jgi:hypothetical protein